MRKILLNPIVTIGLAVVLVSLAIYFVGDLIAIGDWRPLEDPTTQWIVIGALVAIWGAISLIIWWVRRRRNKALVEDIAETPRDLAAEAIGEEQQAIRAKFEDAFKSLSRLKFRNRFGGRRYLYELPWYVFIGPPASGKTTALRNCGLEFPLARGEDIAIEGVAGTRNCDWVFTNDAVFIDTAGRWTTQDAHREVDRAAWNSFLDLLERNRPDEPLNGVILAISVGDLAAADAATVDGYATAIRERLQEISEKLEATVPVYVMFTKADLLVGFTEFFQTLTPEERAQVWGTTFPYEDDAGVEALRRNLGSVEAECDALVERVGEILFSRLNEEIDVGQRARVFEFPAQFSSLKPVVARFLSGVFEPDRYSRPILLRGFYFTSATQVGQPVDRLLARMAHNFGLGGRVISMLSGSGRSYFLRDLLTEVIFPEAGLVKSGGRGRAAARVAKWSGLAACVALPLALAAGWWTVQSHDEAQAAAFTDALGRYDRALGQVELDPVADEDLPGVLPALDVLRDEADRLAGDEAAPPLWGLGVDDTGTIREQAKTAYHNALERLFRPRLLFHLERLMEESLHKPEVLYDNLKAYLMLGGRGPLDEEFLRQFFADDWAKEYGGVENADLQANLEGHLMALISSDMREISLNEETIARARDAVSQITVAERAFLIIRRSKEAAELRPWRITDAARTAQDVFVFRSGQPLDTPIPGLFTYEGFWGFMIHNVDAAAQAAIDEKWLIVDNAEPSREEVVRIRREILQTYYDEYIKRWNEMLADLRFTPLGTPEQAAEVLNFISSNRSPFRRVLEDVVRETSLAAQPAADSSLMTEVKRMGQFSLMRRAQKIGRLASAVTEDVGKRFEGAGQPVQDAFADLRDFVGSEASGSELASVMASLESLYRTTQDLVDQRGADISVLSTTEAASRLSQDAKRAPLGISSMIDDLLQQASAATSSGVRAAIDSIWKTTLYPMCRSAIHGKYPFGNGEEVAIGDLERLLAPGEALDTFFNERLKPMVDTSVTPWAWKPSVAGTIGIPQDRLDFFENAQQIREAFFPREARSAGIRLQVFPIAIDEDVQVGRFEVGGAAVQFTAADREPGQLLWPGAQPANGAQVSVALAPKLGQTDAAAPEYALGETGVWGLFKLLDKNGFRRRGSGDRMRVRFGIEGRSMLLELRFDSAVNPFALRNEINRFRCPASL